MKRFVIFSLFWLISLNAFANPDKAVSRFIDSQHKESNTELVSDTEHGQLITFIYLKNTPNEVLVHWVYQVANFWQHRLTLLRVDGEEFNVLSTIGIEGQVNSVQLDNKTLLVELLGYGKNDPRCCPTERTTKKYEISNGRILPIK